MANFVVHPDDVQAQSLVLRNAEVVHLVRVRRHRVGEEIEVIDGSGRFYQVRIATIERNKVYCEILDSREDCGESPVQLNLAPALIKGQRFDFVIEKTTEIGVVGIFPLCAERGVVKPGSVHKIERWQRLARAAAKQCGRSRMPSVHPPAVLEEVIEGFKEKSDLVLMAAPGIPEGELRQCLEGENARRLGLLIGPEGGFSPAEQVRAKDAGVRLFSWGERTLRADTASIVLATLLMHEAEQMTKK